MNLELIPVEIKLGKIFPDENESMEKIIIPKQIDILGTDTFELIKDKVKVVDMSNSDVGIFETAVFSNMHNLEVVKLPPNLKYISSSAFENCENLKSILIPESITEIRDCAFRGCKSIEDIYIHNNCTYIGVQAFENCENLKHVRLPSNNISIFSDTFDNCSKDIKFFVM